MNCTDILLCWVAEFHADKINALFNIDYLTTKNPINDLKLIYVSIPQIIFKHLIIWI